MSTGDGVDPGAFVLTPALIDAVKIGSLTGSASALILCLTVCLVSIWIYSVPEARHHLDRVSFRLLLWSMGVEVIYNSVFIFLTVRSCSGSGSSRDQLAEVKRDPVLIYNQPACATGVYMLLATMGVCNWLCTCIGVNLMLAITFGINPIQAGLEKWYILWSFVLGFAVPLVPAILGHFGVDPYYAVCYFTQADRTLRIRDFVMDLYFWQLLSCLIAAVSVLTVLITLFRQSRATQNALFKGNTLNMTPSDLRDITTATSATSSSDGRCRRWSVSTLFQRKERRGSQMHRLEDKLTTIALKISLYPLFLILINVVITAEDLSYTSRGGLFNNAQYGVYWLHNFLYGGRGVFFALLGIFVDPCLRLGFPAALRATRHRCHRSPTPGEDDPMPRTDGPEWNDAQSLTNFLSSTGPGLGEAESGSGTPYLLPDTIKKSGGGGGGRSSPRWSPFGSRQSKLDEGKVARQLDLELGDETKLDEGEDEEKLEARRPKSSTPLQGPLGESWDSSPASAHHQPQLSVSFDPDPATRISVDRYIPSPSPLHPPEQPSPRSVSPQPQPPAPARQAGRPFWPQPPGTVEELSEEGGGGVPLRRRSSVPDLSAAQRRKNELRAAAEMLYTQAERKL